MIVDKKVKFNPFRNWFYSQQANATSIIRDHIIEVCGINHLIFYRWLSGQTPVPGPAKYVINIIAGKQLYDVPKLQTIDKLMKKSCLK